MTDHIRAYNVSVKQARTALAEAVSAAIDAYNLAIAPLAVSRDVQLDKAGQAYRQAMADAEAAFDEAKTAYDAGPPF